MERGLWPGVAQTWSVVVFALQSRKSVRQYRAVVDDLASFMNDRRRHRYPHHRRRRRWHRYCHRRIVIVAIIVILFIISDRDRRSQ